MYERFYKLSTNPFRLAPDPKFCFSHSGYKRAMEYFEYALDQGEGFVMVTGRPGTGKTLLVETFIKEIDTKRVIARRIAVSNHGAEELLRTVAYAYDIDAAGMDKATLSHLIQQYFVQQEQAGRRVLLIVDEAQTLEHAALEELRILADLQTESRLMLQLFLVGQESLQELMHTAGMEQFQQRVIANYHLVPLSLKDARAYIEHRLQQAGWNGDPGFTGAAVLFIYQLSKGVPRHINKICNRLLLLGFGKGRHLLDKEDVQEISLEMREEQLTPMEANRARFTEAESISSIPEIQSGLLTIADLAIGANNVGADLSAISEAHRLAAMDKGQFSSRHHEDSSAWNLQHSAPAGAVVHPAAMTIFRRFKWKETLVGAVALLAITTIYIAALPTILGESAGKDRLSHSDQQSRVIQNTASTDSTDLSGSSDDYVIADDLLTEVSAVPVAFSLPAVAGGEQTVTPDMPEEDVLVATQERPDSAVTEEEIPEPAVSSRISWANSPGDSQDSEPQPPVDDVNRPSSPEQSQQLPVVESVQTVAVAAMPVNDATADAERVGQADTSHDETIAELLSQGQQLTKQYQLLTPEDDNAYSYFSKVLRLDPANEAAHAGIQEIVDVYIRLVKMAIYRNDNDGTERYLGRGLSLQPDNRELLALRDSFNRALAGTDPVAGNGPVSQEAAGGMDELTVESIFSRITTFFKKRKDEAERGEVTIPAGWEGG